MTRLMDAPSAGAATVPLQVVRGIVARNATLETALGDALPRGRIYELVEVARPVYDLARLSVGHPFGLALGPGGILEAFTYGIDELQTLRVFRRGEALTASLETRHYDERVVTISGSVESSLFAAVENVGERDQLALDLADIFAWDVDFNTELRAGDSFRVTVEKLSLEGRFSRYGRILAAELQRGDRRLLAVRYDGLGTTGYFAPDGTPLRKAFLRSPLRFSRISSRFSRARLHPILRTVRPHLGVDYAAPVGTPVMAASDGVVTGAGWEGGFGKMVRLRHANGYETFYGHLSRISVRRGQRVQQGATLGAVGQTGLATGPHLDYRMRRNGFFVNPLTVQLPPAEPVPLAERSAFQSVRDRALARLGGTSRGPQAVRSQLGPEDPLLEADGPWRQAR
jgi:murein DD-endopeptidase MepM/ murein hydrolase activator NlpD